MKVNIITEGAWIKRAITDKLVKYSNPNEIEYSISGNQRNDVDINFYICYNTYLSFRKSQVLDIAYVTHIHADDPSKHAEDIGAPFDKFKELDFYVHQSSKSYHKFLELGFPREKSTIVYAPIEVNEYPIKKYTIGIMQNGEVEGKGLFFMQDLLKSYDFSEYFKFIVCGRGWEKITHLMTEKHVQFEYHKYIPEEYYNLKHKVLYSEMDYLFVPSLWEGGPMAILEASACGIPIISSDVGLAGEFFVEYLYKPGNINECIEIFKGLKFLKSHRREKLVNVTYEQFNHHLYEIFTEVINGRIKST